MYPNDLVCVGGELERLKRIFRAVLPFEKTREEWLALLLGTFGSA